MTLKQIENRVAKIEALEEERKEIEKQIETLREAVQAEMGDAEEMETPRFIIRWTHVIRNTFDSKAFKADHARLYEAYTRAAESRRFSFATR